MLYYDQMTISEATSEQERLKQNLDLSPFRQSVKTIAGADISFNKYSTTVYAGIVMLAFPEMRPVACSLVTAEVKFPYVPGFLAFREVPALLKAWEALPQKPDVLVVDGQGVAHPRRMGIAAHFGVLTGQPSIGCAKNLLCGKYLQPDLTKGASQPILDKTEQIGWVLRTKENVNPVFVSPGHRVSMVQSLEIISQCVGRYRIPEPTRHAHEMVNKFRTGGITEGFHRLDSTTLQQNLFD